MSYLSRITQHLLSFEDVDGRVEASCGSNYFHKCRSGDPRGDFCCFVSSGYDGSATDSYLMRVQKAIESASDIVKHSTACAVGNTIFLSLNRPDVFLHGLKDALSCNSQYWRNTLMEGKSLSLTVDAGCLPETPSSWRLEKIRGIIQKTLLFSGGALSTQDEPADFSLVVSNKGRRPVDCGAVVLVGNVNTPFSMEKLHGVFSKEITEMSQVRLSENDQSTDGNLSSLTKASLTFAMLNGNLSKTVNIPSDSCVAPVCKGAVFVLYNFCRMTHVINKYQKLENSGTYPPLPNLDLIDFSLLSSSEEWDLMFNFVAEWPCLLRSVVSEWATGDFKIHRICEFLKSLASKFSAYYRRTRILTEPRSHLLPVLQARIYLILGLMKAYRSALDLLDLQPVQNM